jgi:PAS domain S-box-containing protein
MATVDKKLLKRLKVLYVEDDTSIRNELSSLLSNFFDNVYTADDGRSGLELYAKKQDDIDVIIADINMPKLNGIEMIEKIREFDKNVPVIFATAYSDNDFLIGAIKLKVFEYIIKPIDIRKLMAVLTDLATIIYHDFLLNQQNKELKKFKDILNSNNIVVRTNKNMKISFVNNLFCEITGFDKKELIGEELDYLKHPDVNPKIYTKIHSYVLHNKQFKGELKNITKDGNFYISDTSVISTLNDAGEVTGCLMIQKDKTKEVLKRREVQSSLIKDKGEIFIKGKESSAELKQSINHLKDEVLNAKNEAQRIKDEKDKYIFTIERYTNENKKLRVELKQNYRQVVDTGENRTSLIKLSKENADLRIEVKKLSSKLKHIKDEHAKECKQIKVNYEVEIDDLEQELSDIHKKLGSIENAEAITQKLAYWKEKAKNESKKIEKLEKDIIKYGDKTMMNKLFGGR